MSRSIDPSVVSLWSYAQHYERGGKFAEKKCKHKLRKSVSIFRPSYWEGRKQHGGLNGGQVIAGGLPGLGFGPGYDWGLSLLRLNICEAMGLGACHPPIPHSQLRFLSQPCFIKGLALEVLTTFKRSEGKKSSAQWIFCVSSIGGRGWSVINFSNSSQWAFLKLKARARVLEWRMGASWRLMSIKRGRSPGPGGCAIHMWELNES